jgi:hypothetical protein
MKMKFITYKDLKDFLNSLSDEQLNMNVTIGVISNVTISSENVDVNSHEEFDEHAEYFGCSITNIACGSSTLDDNHPYIGIIT